MNNEDRKQHVRRSLGLWVSCLLLLALDLIAGKAFIAGVAGLSFTRNDDPFMYWILMCFYLVFGILFYRSYIKDKALLSSK
jgi:hypothetical protein